MSANILLITCKLILLLTVLVNCQEVKPSFDDYPTHVPGSCGSVTKFDCGNGKCIDFSLVRNCVDNCGNGADEFCGNGLTLCDTSVVLNGCGKCVYGGSESSYCVDQRYGKLCSQPASQIFKCLHTQNCVLKSWILNGVDECGDLSDENPCFVNQSNCDNTATCSYNYNTKQANCYCSTLSSTSQTCTVDPLSRKIPGKCSITPLQFDCGEKCISIQQFRDCHKDCADGSDEYCWQGLVQCSDGCTCVQQNRQALDCPTAANPCLTQVTNCNTNANCFPTNQNNGYVCQCKPGFVGDGRTCSYAAQQPSQIDILSRIPGSCRLSPLEFDCGNGVCIPIAKFRDCIKDCADGSDEVCWAGQTKCDGCKCVNPLDVKTTCLSVDACAGSGMFSCATGGCVFDSMVLDGTCNCVDCSDENYCSTILTSCPINFRCVYNIIYHNFTCGCPSGSQLNSRGFCQSVNNQNRLPNDCADYQVQNRNTGTGIFTVYKPNCVSSSTNCAMQVSCDFNYQGGGWTVIQQRQDGSVDFNKNWTDYKNGFGSMNNEFWLGNDYVSQLTQLTNRPVLELLIIMTTLDGTPVTARYDKFQLSLESDKYRLTLGTFTQGDNDNLAASRDQRFGTADMDVDSDPSITCGVWWRSGWWHEPKCARTGDLNVPYNPIPMYGQLGGIIWVGTAHNARMKSTKMMIRPLGFVLPDTTTMASTTTIAKLTATLPHGTVPTGRSKSPVLSPNTLTYFFSVPLIAIIFKNFVK